MSEISQQPVSTELHTPRFHIKPEQAYQPVDTIKETTEAGVSSTAIGLLFAAISNSAAKRNVGPFGIITNSGALVGSFAIGGAGYAFGRAVSNNLREKNDALNDFYGGALGGALVGTFTKSVSKTIGCSALVGILCGLTAWGGYSITGLGRDSSYNTIDKTMPFKEGLEPEKKQGFWEMVHRRPLSQTVKDLGKDNVVFQP